MIFLLYFSVVDGSAGREDTSTDGVHAVPACHARGELVGESDVTSEEGALRVAEEAAEAARERRERAHRALYDAKERLKNVPDEEEALRSAKLVEYFNALRRDTEAGEELKTADQQLSELLRKRSTKIDPAIHH